MAQGEPVLGRLRFKATEDVAALSWCVRLDYQVDKVPHIAWEYPKVLFTAPRAFPDKIS
jgi:hypothetical protein